MRSKLDYIPAIAVAVAFGLSFVTIGRFVLEEARRTRSSRRPRTTDGAEASGGSRFEPAAAEMAGAP